MQVIQLMLSSRSDQSQTIDILGHWRQNFLLYVNSRAESRTGQYEQNQILKYSRLSG